MEVPRDSGSGPGFRAEGQSSAELWRWQCAGTPALARVCSVIHRDLRVLLSPDASPPELPFCRGTLGPGRGEWMGPHLCDFSAPCSQVAGGLGPLNRRRSRGESPCFSGLGAQGKQHRHRRPHVATPALGTGVEPGYFSTRELRCGWGGEAPPRDSGRWCAAKRSWRSFQAGGRAVVWEPLLPT